MKTSAANVIDLEAFRQRKMARARQPEPARTETVEAPMLVPFWFCWVPMWTPIVG